MNHITYADICTCVHESSKVHCNVYSIQQMDVGKYIDGYIPQSNENTCMYNGVFPFRLSCEFQVKKVKKVLRRNGNLQ